MSLYLSVCLFVCCLLWMAVQQTSMLACFSQCVACHCVITRTVLPSPAMCDMLCLRTTVRTQYVHLHCVSTQYKCAGKEVWVNSLTVIVINPKRQRGGGAKPAAAQV